MVKFLLNLLNFKYLTKLIFILVYLFRFVQNENNMIIVAKGTLKYLNFLTFSNSDMLFETSLYNKYGYTERIFYCLKNNGRYYFGIQDQLQFIPLKIIITIVKLNLETLYF